jgi:hypothetical protein
MTPFIMDNNFTIDGKLILTFTVDGSNTDYNKQVFMHSKEIAISNDNDITCEV